jgi:hypothetical protein
MAFVAAITDVGNAAAEAAEEGAYQIEITSATFSSNLLTPTIPFLETVTSMTNVTYTAPTDEISYHIINDNEIMLRVNLTVADGPFNFGSYSLNLSDGTPFAVGTWTVLQTKDNSAARYVELTIAFTNFTGVLNVTILNTIDAALPEVPTEAGLPAAESAPYPVYYVDQWTAYQNVPALASRFSGSWYFYPSQQTYYIADSGAINALVANFAPAFTSLTQIKEALYIRVANSNTMEITLNVNGLGVLPVVNLDNSPLIPGQIVQNSIIAVIYDPTNNNFQLLTPIARPSRVRLVAPLNLYVSTTGSDSNDGLTIGTPWLHQQTAWNYIQDNLDANSQSIQANMADGTYDAGVFAANPPLGANAGINFLGNYHNPGNAITSITSGDCYAATAGIIYQVEGFTVAASTTGGDYVGGGAGIATTSGGIIYYAKMQFEFCAGAHMDASGDISSLGRPYIINGASPVHTSAETGGDISTADSFVEIVGDNTFSFAFVSSRFNSVNSAWLQVWGNSGIIEVKINNAGSTLSDGTRTFTAAGGEFNGHQLVFTATVSGGSVVSIISITDPGDYNIVFSQPTVTVSSGAILTVASTTNIVGGMQVGHLQIPAGTTVISAGAGLVLLSNSITGTINDFNDEVVFMGMPQLEANPCAVDFGSTDATFDLIIARGLRYYADTNSTINTRGASLKYFPGDTAGDAVGGSGGYIV